jgi:myo-inositol 2-dehydrogenase/D-chiro-inositol 1-dehydrogenase
MKTITVGVIGLGRIGKLHVNNILQMHDVNIAMVYDPVLDDEWKTERGLISVADEKNIYTSSRIDAVLIFSPSMLHAGQIVEAAKAGKHVFCEKPIALDPKQIKNVLSVVNKQGVKLQIGFNRRFDPDFLKVKKAIADGLIGDLHLIKITARDPEPPPVDYVEISGGIFLDMTIHDFDMVRFLSGNEIKEVYSKGAVLIDKSIGDAGDVDTAVTSLRLRNGALAVIDNSRSAVYGYDQRIEAFGSKGSISAENILETNTILMTEENVRTDKPLYFFLERYKESFWNEMREFIDMIKNDYAPSVTGEDGLMSTKVGLAAKRSLESHMPVKIQYD